MNVWKTWLEYLGAHLDVDVIHVLHEALDAIIISCIVEKNKAGMYRIDRHEGKCKEDDILIFLGCT